MAVGVLVSCALACAALAQQGDIQHLQAVETSRNSRAIGLQIVRTIVTAEVTDYSQHGGFVGWDELYRAPDEQKPWERLHLSAGPEIVPGWKLHLVASADGKHFELSLNNVSDKCAFSFFSDESGVIYQGGAIDCSVDLKPADD